MMSVRIVYKYPVEIVQGEQRLTVGGDPKILHFDLNPDSLSDEPALWIEHDQNGGMHTISVFIVGTGWPLIGDPSTYKHLGTVIRPRFGGVWHLYRMVDPA